MLCSVVSVAISLATVAVRAEVPRKSLESARLNNIGVAYMNQQLTERALGKFEEAHTTDTTAPVPLLNKGIALLYLRRLPEAEVALKSATSAAPQDPRGWYSLGLTHFDSGSQQQALGEFKQAVKLDPSDADSHYFVGTVDLGLKEYVEAIAEFESAIALNPLHASAQFGLARALQRSGNAEQARVHLKRFQEITQAKIGTPLSAVYGEQGHYATVQDMRSSSTSVSPMIPVTFVQAGAVEGSSVIPQPVPGIGGGSCLLDLSGKGEKDILVLHAGDHPLRAFHLTDKGAAEISLEGSGLNVHGTGLSCAVGDYDNDGRPDLAIALEDKVALFHNLGGGKFAEATASSGLRTLNHPSGLSFVDFDHDGDLDLFITGSSLDANHGPNLLWRNNGNLTFTEWTSPTGLTGSGSTISSTLSDINNDRAVDLITTGGEGSPTIYENQREGAFRQVRLYADKLTKTRGVVVADFNKDGWMDVALTHEGSPAVTLWVSSDGKSFKSVPLPVSGTRSAWGLTAIDFDNDGWIDLAVLVQTAKGVQVRMLRNCGPEGFRDVSDQVGLEDRVFEGARALMAADLRGEGASDLIVSGYSGIPVILTNVGGNKHHALRIALTGLADNKTALGTKVEVFAEGTWQKFEVAGSSGYLSQGSTEILAGLGETDHADVVRMLWPTGVPQDELDVSSKKVTALTELDRRGSSCPVLFAWNGNKYTFITDVIGAAVVGHWTSPASRNQSDSDEWVKIDGADLRSRDGLLSVRFGEPMEEINYIDQLRLVAVDHPDGTDVFPDERFESEPPFASGRTVIASSKARSVAGAWDNTGKDVTGLLLKQDHKYVKDFTNLPYAGFATPHTLTLDLGSWSESNPLRLFLHGFVEYFSATSMYSAWQAGLRPQPPTLEVQMADGTWKLILADMGFPAGLPRTIVVDLSGKLPKGARRVRLRSNLQVYWDQALVDNGADTSNKVHQYDLPLASAHLAFRGYPKQIDGRTPGDLTYDYQSMSLSGPFQWQKGGYTRFGDVTPLLNVKDDQYVIFGSGEDIDVEFSDSALPPLPAKWKRDYFFYADGFVKDMDFYEALPFTVAQLPFHSMSGYPYSKREHFPDTRNSIEYTLDWNDRFESGNRTQPYQFRYEKQQSTPMSDR